MRPDGFITPEHFHEDLKKRDLSGPNGWLLFVACNEGLELARKVQLEYDSLLKEKSSELKGIPLSNDSRPPAWKETPDCLIKRVSDTETIPRLPEHVAGSNAFVFQYVHELKTGNTVNENLMRLLQMIWTLKVHGAKNVTAVIPYHPYARQDKPTFMMREGTLAKFVADMIVGAGANDVITYHPHTEGIRGFYEPRARLNSLNGLDLFLEIAEPYRKRSDVVCVSPDAGGAKFNIHFANALGVEYAISNKYRTSDRSTDLIGIIGNVEDKSIAIIGDDETVTFGTLRDTAKALHQRYEIPEIQIMISHNKIRQESVPELLRAHEEFGVTIVHTTDSIAQRREVLELPFVRVHSIAKRIALTINRLHYNQSKSEIFYKPSD